MKKCLLKRKLDRLGKIRPSYIKKISRILMERFPEKVNSDFENNKKIVDNLTNVSSNKLRNRIAGYITHLVSIKRD
jgi:small subunit ribosomal protein S17e